MKALWVLLFYVALTNSYPAYGVESVPQIKGGTEFHFDEMPLGQRLSMGMRKALPPRGPEGVFTENELALMTNAFSVNHKPLRTMEIIGEVCSEYEQSSNLNLSRVGSQLAQAEQYDIEDRYQVFIDVFEKLSTTAQAIIEYEMETYRGTRAVGSSLTDWERLFQESPETAASVLRRICERYPEIKRSKETQPETKSFDNATSIYISQ